MIFGNRKPTEDHIKKLLADVVLPDQTTPLSQSSALSHITLDGHKVTVILNIAPHQAEAFEPLRALAEQRLVQDRRIKQAHVILTAEKPMETPVTPVRPKTLQNAQDNAQPEKTEKPAALNSVKRIIAVSSGKGGVGKSTVTANLAAACAAQGLKIGILDADIYGPSMPTMFGAIDVQPETNGPTMIPVERHDIKLMSSGFIVHGRGPLVWRGPMVHKALIQMLGGVAWGDLDILFIDMPPGTGDVPLTLAKQAPFDGAIIVSTPQDIALSDARKGIEMFKKLEIPLLGMIENMAHYCCPKCGHEDDIFGTGGAESEAKETNIPFLGKLSLHPETRKQADHGTPITLAMPDHTASLEYKNIASKIIG